MQEQNPKFISMMEASRLCSYSQEYLSLLARRGKIFSKKIGRNWYTTREAIDEYLKQQSVIISLPKKIFAQTIAAAQALTPEEPEESKTGLPGEASAKTGHEGHSRIFEEFERLNPQIVLPKSPAAEKEIFSPPSAKTQPILPRPFIQEKTAPLVYEQSGSRSFDISFAARPQSELSLPDKKEISSNAVIEKLDKLSDSLVTFAGQITQKISEQPAQTQQQILNDEQREFFTVESRSLFYRLKKFNIFARSSLSNPTKMMAVMISAIVLLFILAGGFSFGQADYVVQQIKKAFKDADTVQGHFPGTHANEVLVLDKVGNISIFGHIETQGQLRSRAPDGVAPIVVDSVTKVENLNADYLDDLDSKDFTLAFVTKNGNITYEDVFLEGNVEVGKTLIVKGAAKLLDSLTVYGQLGVFSDAVFGKNVTLTKGNLVLEKGTIQIFNQSLIKNLNAEFLDGIRKGDINLNFVTTNGATTPNGISVGGLEVNGQSDFRGMGFFHKGVWGSDAAFGSLGVSGDVSIGNSDNPADSIFQVYSKKFKVDTSGNITASGAVNGANLVTGGDLTVSGKVKSDLIPSGSFNLGSSSNRWQNVFAVNGLFTGNLTISGSMDFAGTASSSFVINTDNTSSDLENAYLSFERGAITPNATLKWNSTANRFEFNEPVLISSSSFAAWGDISLGSISANVLTINASTVSIPNNLNFDGNSLFLDAANNRVGVLTNAPSTIFEVQGTVSASYGLFGSLQIAGFSSTSYSRFGTNTTSYSDSMTAANDLLLSGNLEVDSDVFFDANASVSGNLEVAGNLTVANLSFTNASVSGNFEVGGVIKASDGTAAAPSYTFENDIDTGLFRIGDNALGFSAFGALRFAIRDTGASLSNNFEITGTASISSNLNTYGTNTFAGTGSHTATGEWNFDSNTLVIDAGTNNVGIGTTAPASKLDVNGDLKVGNSSDFTTGGRLFTHSTGGLTIMGKTGTIRDFQITNPSGALLLDNPTGTSNIEIPNGSLFVNQNASVSQKFEVGTSVFFANATTGNVGIGTNAPTTKFEVQGTASASYLLTSNTLQVGGFASAAYSRFGTSATTHTNYISANNDLLISGDLEVIGTGSFRGPASLSNTMWVSPGGYSGNVGIGTSEPASKLQISGGNVQVDGNKWFGLDGGNHYVPWDGVSAAIIQQSADTGRYISLQAEGGSPILAVRTDTSNVGVGTTSPATKFEVQGTASASNFFTVGSIQVGTGGATATVSYNRFGSAATTHPGSIAANNDLLISGDLEVDGSVSFDGPLTISGGTSISGNFSISGVIKASDGTAAAPSYTFTNDIDTGLFRIGENNIGFTAGGVQRFNISDTGASSSVTFESAGTIKATTYTGDGAVTLLSGGSNTLRIDAGGSAVVNIGDVNATAINIARTGVLTTFNGNITGPQSLLTVTGNLDATGHLKSGDELIVTNAAQFGGTATVAYSRFGTNTTGHSLSAATDLLISGNLEVDGTAYFDASTLIAQNASVSGTFEATAIKTDSISNSTGTLTINAFTLGGAITGNNQNITGVGNLGIGTTSPATKFEVQGTASASNFFTVGSIQVGSGAAAATVSYNRFGVNATSHTNYISANNDLLISGDLEVDASAAFDGHVIIGNATDGTDLLTVNSQIISDLIPNGSTRNVGSAANRWNYGYFTTLDVTTLSVASTSISGTNNNAFTINADNATADAEDAFLVFERGTSTPNSQLKWDSTNKRFDFNFPVFVQNTNTGDASNNYTKLTLKAGNTQGANDLFEIQNKDGLRVLLVEPGGNLIASGAFQAGGLTVASASYSRFGTAATTHTGSIAAANDLLISGDFEVDGSAAFDGFALFGSNASVSGKFETAGAAEIGTNLTINNNANVTGNLGIGTTSPATRLEVQGTASASYGLFGSLQIAGFSSTSYSRFGTNTTGHSLSAANDLLISGILEADGQVFFDSNASVSGTLEGVTIKATTYTGDAAVTLLSGGSNTLRIDAGGAAALNIGDTNASSLTLSRTTVVTVLNDDIRVIGNDIQDSTSTSRINFATGYTDFNDDIELSGNDIRDSAGTNRITFSTTGATGLTSLTGYASVSQDFESAGKIIGAGILQIGGADPAAYSRFGTGTTSEAHYITASNDVLVSGDLEVDGSVSFAGPASISNTLYVSTLGKTGNVGIGTVSPSTALEVSASVLNPVKITSSHVNGSYIALNATATDGRNWWIGSSINSSLAPVGSLLFYDATGLAGHMLIQSDGNVGIGTTSATTKFQVSGSASVSANFEVGGTASASAFSLPSTAGGTLGDCDAAGDTLNWDATTKKFTCGTDASASGSGVASNSLDFDEFVNAMTLDANLTIASAGFSMDLLRTNFEIGGTASIGNTLFIQKNTGNVGIGTSAPTLAASYRGLEIVAPTSFAAALRLTPPSGKSYEFVAPSTNKNFGLYDVASASYRFYLQHDGNIGIGAIDSTSRLTVQGRGEFQGTASASYLLTGNTLQVGGFASAAYNRFGTSATTHANYISANNDLLISGDLEVIGTGSFRGPASLSNTLWVSPGGYSGNVGIGTTAPSILLDVRQNSASSVMNTVVKLFQTNNAGAGANDIGSRITFGGETTTEGTVDMAAAVGGLLTTATAGAVDGELAFYTRTGGASFVEQMRIDKNGNVGIGTTSSLTKFEVQGTASASNLFTVGSLQIGAGTVTATVSYNRFGTSATTHTNYISANSDLLISGDLEVIGTSSFKTASISTAFGSAFPTSGTNGCSGATTDKLLWNNTTNRFTCGSDQTGGGGGGSGLIEVRELGVYGDTTVASLSFDPGKFALSASGSFDTVINLDWGSGGPASLSQNETVTGFWNFSASSTQFAGIELIGAASVSAGASNLKFNLDSTGDFVIQDAAVTFATFSDTGIFTLDNLRFDGNTIDTTTGDLTLNANSNLVSIAANANVTGNLGIGTTSPATRLEVQGTASVSYLLTGNSLQVGGFASAAYSRFGTAATTHTGSIAAANDLLISGDFEVDGSAAFDGFALFGGNVSVSGTLEPASVKTDTLSNSTGTLTINAFTLGGTLTGNNQNITGVGNLGIGTTSPATRLEVQGTASASYGLFGSLQIAGFSSTSYSRFGTNATGHSLSAANDLLISGILEADGQVFFDSNASVSGTLEGVTIKATTYTGDAAVTLLSGGSNTLRIDAGGAAALNIGDVNASSLTLSRTTVVTVFNDDIRIIGNDIQDSTSTPRINFATGYTDFNDDIELSGGDIRDSGGTNRISFSTAGATGLTALTGYASVSQDFESAGKIIGAGVLQIGGADPAAYSRFGTAATGYTSELNAANDLLISGSLEVDGNVFFDANASISGNLEVSGSITGSSITYSTASISNNFEVGGVIKASDGSASAPSYTFSSDENTGLFRINTDQIGFTTSGVEKMRIDSNGFVGIGTTSPATRLEVQGTASASYGLFGALQVAGFSSTSYSRFGTNTTGHSLSAASDLLISGILEADGQVFFDSNASVSGTLEPASVKTDTLSNSTGTLTINAFTLGGAITGNNQNITGLGNLGIGTTSPATRLEVQGTASASYGLFGSLQIAGFSSTSYSRFGTNTTGHSLSAASDLLISGILEADGQVFFDSNASVSSNFEASGYASASKTFGSGLTDCDNASGSKLLWDISTGKFSCGTDQTGGGGGSGSLQVREGTADGIIGVATISFDPSHFTLTSSTSVDVLVKLDWNAGGPASLSQNETVTGFWNFSASSTQFAGIELIGAASVSAGANNLKFNLDSTGDFIIQDAAVTFATFDDTGIFTLDNLRFDGNTIDTTTGDLTLDANSNLVSIAANASVSGTLEGAGTVKATTFTGDGAVTLLSGGANTLRIDAGGAGALNIGDVSATSVGIARTGVLTTFNGNITGPASLLTVTGNLNATGYINADGYLKSGDELIVTNAAQFGGTATVAYSRFGTGTTSEAHYITASNDVLVSGDLEVDGSVSFAGPASISNTLYVSTLGKTGNVGVGTSAPTTKLDVSGTEADTSYAPLRIGGSYVPSGANTRWPLQFADSVGTYRVMFGFSNDANADTLLNLTNASASKFRFIKGGDIDNPFMVVDSSGNVGIGTASPVTKFEVQGTASASYGLFGSLQIAGFSSQSYSRFGTGTTGHSLSTADDVLVSGDLEVDGSLFIDGSFSMTNASISNELEVGSYASIANTMWVSPPGYTGNVGIGTSAPAAILYVNANTSAGSSVRNVNTGTGTGSFASFIAGEDASTKSTGLFYFNNSYTAAGLINPNSGLIQAGAGATNGLVIKTNAVAPIIFGINASTEAMRIDGTGNVGIAATSPEQRLNVGGNIIASSSIDTELILNSIGAGTNEGKFSIVASGAAGIDSLFIRNGTSETNLVTIASIGQVLIGTTTVSNANPRLTLKGRATNAISFFIEEFGSTDRVMDIYEETTDSGAILRLYNGSSQASISFDGNGNSYFDGGNVGIGTTSPGNRFNVNGSGTTGWTSRIDSPSGGLIYLGHSTAGYGMYIDTGAANSSYALRVQNGSTVYHDLLSDGSSYHSGNMGVGTSTTTQGRIVSSIGSTTVAPLAVGQTSAGLLGSLRYLMATFSPASDGSTYRGSIQARINDGGGNSWLEFYTHKSGQSSTALGDRLSLSMGGSGYVGVGALAGASGSDLCYDSTTIAITTTMYTFATCSSSIKYKENVADLTVDKNKVFQLRPVSFKWKNRDENDVGLIAEEVEPLVPELVFYKDGLIEGVKYKQLTVYLLDILRDMDGQVASNSADILGLENGASQSESEIALLQSAVASLSLTVEGLLAQQASASSGVTISSSGTGITDTMGTIANAVLTRVQSLWATGDIIAEGVKKTYFALTDTLASELGSFDVGVAISNWLSREIAISPTADIQTVSMFSGSGAQAAGESKLDLVNPPAGGGAYLATYGVDATKGTIVLSGSSQISGGEAKIFFDYSFSSVISDTIPLKVLLTPTTTVQGQLYVANKTKYGFVVKSLNGSGEANFDWLAIARRKGYEGNDLQGHPLQSPSFSPTPTPSVQGEPLLSPSPTPLASESPIPSPTIEPTLTPSVSETPSPTLSPSETPTPTPPETPTLTPTPSDSPTPTPTPTPTPSDIPTPTPTPIPSDSPTPTPTP